MFEKIIRAAQYTDWQFAYLQSFTKIRGSYKAIS